MNPHTNALTVSELNQQAKSLLEQSFRQVWVKGEISNFVQPASGHWYFTLKDKTAQVRCAMFRLHQTKTHCFPKDGMEVIVTATVSLYPNRGEYQLIATQLDDMGTGQLLHAFEQLKKRIEKQGLFDSKHKKTLPAMPKHIGVISSDTGAAWHDILFVLRQRYPVATVTLYPSLVQGEKAAANLIKQLQLAENIGACDVLILARGGGSLEDLWCFNNESLAHAILACPIPIISGIGHEIDFTIADFVADVRAATPSAAAATATPDHHQLYKTVQQSSDNLQKILSKLLADKQAEVNGLHKQVQARHPKQTLINQQQTCDRLLQDLLQAMRQHLFNHKYQLQQLSHPFTATPVLDHIKQSHLHLRHYQQRLSQQMQRCMTTALQKMVQLKTALDLLNPVNTLLRGYSITFDAQHGVLSKTNTLKVGDTLYTKLAQGEITSTITHLPKPAKP